MARLVLLLLGAIAGAAAAVHWLDPSSAPGPATTETSAPPLPVLPEAVADADATGFAAARLVIYEQAAQATDALDVESLFDRALDEPPSRLRDLRLTALLARLAEIDPARAVEFARTRYVEPALLVPLFEKWAVSDAQAAIAELALIAPASRQREIALAILAVIGSDADGIERVAAALPESARASFEMDVLLARAELDPMGAMRELIAMPNGYPRSLLMPQVAEIVARTDPRGALAQVASIGEYALRRTLRDAVFAAWAQLEPDAVYAWIENAEIGDLPESAAVYQALAVADADRLFAALDGLPPMIRTNAQRAAMQALAESDPVAALARLDAMPMGPDRANLLQTIAQAYARQNPDLALAWVRSLPATEAQATMRSVLQGMMAVDPDRAIDVLLAEIETGGRAGGAPASASVASSLSLLISLSSATGGSAADFGRIADRLLAANNPQLRSVISSSIGNWARQDPDSALRWALDNAGRLDDSAFQRMAQSLAATDPERALLELDRIPPDQRPEWFTGLAQQLGQTDPDRALELLNRYRGQPEYAGAFAAVAQGLARTDPVRAAAVLRDAPPGNTTQNLGGYSAVAREWSRTDPAAAADWAIDIDDETVRRQAILQVTQSWAARDLPAAERWLLGLNPGTQRDAALDGLVSASAQAGRFEPRLLDAYSTPQAAQQGAATAIRNIGRSDPREAQRLLDAHITDANLRRQVEDFLLRSGGSGSGSAIVTSGGVIL